MDERIRLRKEKSGARVNHKTIGLNKTKSQSNQSPVDRILNLQKTIGNRAVTRLIRSGVLQVSLKIGQPGDIYEKEADRVAEQVMRMPEQAIQRQAEEEEEEPVQAKLRNDSLLQRQAEEEEEEPVQAKMMENSQLQRQEEEEEEISRKALGNSAAVSSDIESRIQSLKGGGQPLSESTRAFFEPRFGIDFSQVRVHTDSSAAETARAINAKAFTTGKDIVFGSGQYSPGTSAGKRLLAHELTHAAQQGSSCLRFNSSQKKQHLRLREKLVKTKLNPGAIGLIIQRQFINRGMRGTDRVHWAGGTGARGNQGTGSIQRLVLPVLLGRNPGRRGHHARGAAQAWLRPRTGIIRVVRSYTGVRSGDQGGRARHRWHITRRAARRTNRHESIHIGNSRYVYRRYISPLLRLVQRYEGRRNALRYGSTRAEATARLRTILDWNTSVAKFRAQDTVFNAPGGSVDQYEPAAGTNIVDCGAGNVGRIHYNHRATTPDECP